MPQFLTDEWIEAAQAIQAELADELPESPPAKVNLVVPDAPFADGDAHFHLDTSDGLVFSTGTLDDADVTMTMPYATAKAVLVEGNQQAGMQAFMGGQMKVDGDMMKVMTLQGAMANPAMSTFREKLEAATD
ncbi:MAG: SCP2 sterol-binding domain-containing protein [Nitriliruptorales bacterium]|nr:SCP2 sterol-binding domain-containing protein [Nitriliruptorales bacterium]